MFLELGDRLIRERAPVLVFFHIRNQRRLGADEPRRFAAERLRIQGLAMKGLGEVVDDFQLRVARLGKLLHVGAAIRVSRSSQPDGQKEPRRQPSKSFFRHRTNLEFAAPDSPAQTPEKRQKRGWTSPIA